LFFNLLDIHRRLLDRVNATGHDSQPVGGTEAFRVLYNQLIRELQIISKDGPPEEVDKINQAYLRFYNIYQSEIGHYFRNLYHIIRFIDASQLADSELYKVRSSAALVCRIATAVL
jgi:hypothetical protein